MSVFLTEPFYCSLWVSLLQLTVSTVVTISGAKLATSQRQKCISVSYIVELTLKVKFSECQLLFEVSVESCIEVQRKQ